MQIKIGTKTVCIEVELIAKGCHEAHLVCHEYSAPLKFGMLNSELMQHTKDTLTKTINNAFDDSTQNLFKPRIDQFVSDLITEISKQVIKMADLVV